MCQYMPTGEGSCCVFKPRPILFLINKICLNQQLSRLKSISLDEITLPVHCMHTQVGKWLCNGEWVGIVDIAYRMVKRG